MNLREQGCSGEMPAPSVVERVRSVTFVGMLLNIVLTLLKAVGGILFQSQVLVADAVHSLSDLVTDLAVIFGVKYWSAPPDESHPYGHGRIETLVSAFIGIALVLVASGLIGDAVAVLRAGTEQRPGLPAFFIALVSILLKEWLFRWTRSEGRKMNSKALEANAWHHRSDAFSSIPAAIAVILAHFFPALHFVDPLGAILVSIFIFHAAWKIVKPTLLELSDARVTEKVQELTRIASSVPGVCGVHAVRCRLAGASVLADLHVTVDPEMTVRDGHALSHRVRSAILEAVPQVTDVIVHLEPGNDPPEKIA
ncbi:MAG: cation diffusion facilitator family transporter [Victivallales bacterium]